MSEQLTIDQLMAKCQEQESTIRRLQAASLAYERGINRAQGAILTANLALQWMADNDQTARSNGGDPYWYAEQAPRRAREAIVAMRRLLGELPPEDGGNTEEP
jgi:hypothetical protein